MRVLDVGTGKSVFQFPGGRTAAFDAGGILLAVAGALGKVNVFRTDDWKEVQVLDHGEPVQSLAFIGHGRELAAGGIHRQIRTWQVGTWETKSTFKDFAGDTMAIRFSFDGQWIATKSWHSQIEENVIRLRDLRSGSGQPLASYIQGDPYQFELSREGRYMLVNGWSNKVVLFELRFEAKTGHIEIAKQVSYPVSVRNAALAFDPQTRHVAIGGETALRLLDALSGHDVGKIDQPKAVCVAFVHDGNALAAAGDGRLLVWNFGAGRALLRELIKTREPLVGERFEKEILTRFADILDRIGRDLTMEERAQYLNDEPLSDADAR